MNLAGYLIQETPSKVQEAVELTEIFPEKFSWDVRLRVSNMLLACGKTYQAKKLIAELDSVKYFEQATSVQEINLLLRVLALTDRGDEVLSLIESTKMTKRFSAFDDMDIKLRAANTLWSQGQVEQASTLIANFDGANYLNQATNSDQADFLLNTMVSIGQTSEVIQLLERKSIPDCWEKTLIGAKISCANHFNLQGRKKEAETLLRDINPDALSIPQQASLLGMTYNRLGLFDLADKVFTIFENKGFCCPNFYVHKAITHLCLMQYEEAHECISRDISTYGQSIHNLFWEMRVLNVMRQYEATLPIAEEAMAHYASSPTHRCWVLIEQGIATRSVARLEDALTFFHEATLDRNTEPPWLWIAYFEYAMTLILLGKNGKARAMAINGHRIAYPKARMPYNPCTILSIFLGWKQRLKVEQDPPLAEWISYAKRWPWPFLPYHLWIFLFTAMILKADNNLGFVEKHLYVTMTNDIFRVFSALLSKHEIKVDKKKHGRPIELNGLISLALSQLCGTSSPPDIFLR